MPSHGWLYLALTMEPDTHSEEGSFPEEPRGDGAASPAATGRRRRVPAPVLFVGGTGRSGSHIVARLVTKTRDYSLIPVECRFHSDEDGFPGLLAGKVSKEHFVRRLRGRWWKGFQTDRFRGLHKVVPRERFDRAVEAFDERFDSDPEGACRQLFFDLLQDVRRKPQAKSTPGIVEQSTDNVAQAATLLRLFPEARFIHVVRDGRDASASRVSQRKWLVYPRTRRQGLEWWEQRVRRIDAGARAIPEEKLFELELGELLVGGRACRLQMRRLARFIGVRKRKRMMRFMRQRMSPRTANEERWREGLSERRQDEIDRAYREIIDRMEADGVRSAVLLRQAYERPDQREAPAREAAVEGDPGAAAEEPLPG
jgi:hypothetical protein